MSTDPIADFEDEVRAFLAQQGVDVERAALTVPPEREFGEASSNAPFLLARERRRKPAEIAADIAAAFRPDDYRFIGSVQAAGAGFLNFYVKDDAFLPHVVQAVAESGSLYGRPGHMAPRHLLVEHTSVNPNKEWHVGHLRNAVLGDVVVRVARLAGHTVEVQNYIDDTGRQAAEALHALQSTADTWDRAEKYDHFVGRQYVALNARKTALETLRKETGAAGDGHAGDGPEQLDQLAELNAGIDAVLHALEEGSQRRTVEDIVAAQLETAARLGIFYDLLVWESDIVRARLLEEALWLLEQSPRVYVPTTGPHAGALVIEMPPAAQGKGGTGESVDAEPNTRVLVRSNGLPTYTGKDVAYMMWKFGLLQTPLHECPFAMQADGRPLATTCPEGRDIRRDEPDSAINVVGEHQALQQRTVAEALRAAGYSSQADRIHHLSYGMVSQAAGKISGRHGTGSAADDVLDEAVSVARDRVREKRPDIGPEERDRIAEAIGIGAIRYLMVQYNPIKPIVFDIEDVVSFEGNTGLYLQYALVRVQAVLRKAGEGIGIDERQMAQGDVRLLRHTHERDLLIKVARFPSAIADAMRTLNVNLIADYAHTLAGTFSQFYRDCPVLSAEPELRLARLRLVLAVRDVMRGAAAVLGVPVVERL